VGRVTTLCAVFSCLAPTARAEDAERSFRAEELFRDGKTLLGERDYARACPLLATSFDLDPATGTLLALAICHEGEGKLASASAEYKEAAQRAKTEGRPDRERVARERALALESRLSTLAITPPPEAWTTDDFVIRRSGIAVEREAWDTAVALDGGEYIIEASAAGKKPWRDHVTLAPSAERRNVAIPPLENVLPQQPMVAASPAAPMPPAEPGAPVSQKPVRRDEPNKGESGLTTLQQVGIGGMVAGAVGIGVGTVYAFRAMSKNEDSNQHGCDGDTCVGQGKEDRLAARTAGDTATVFFAVGGTLAVGGVVMFLLGAPSDDAGTSALLLQPRVSIEARGVELTLDARF
jgi:hypothetical protein